MILIYIELYKCTLYIYICITSKYHLVFCVHTEDFIKLCIWMHKLFPKFNILI